MTVRGIEGGFGSGKTSLSAYMASLTNPSDTIVLSNIKLNKQLIPNYVFFDDDEFLELLRTANFYNDIERALYSKFNEKTGLYEYQRSKFTKFVILFDEAGAIMNGRFYKEVDKALSIYINQQRKNFEDIYIITADGQQTDKSLRRFCEEWYYCKPLLNFWIFKYLKIVRRQIKDSEGNIMMESYLGRDQQGDLVVKQKPMDYYLTWFYQPFIWAYYEDLHKNIQDPDKHKISYPMLKNMIKYKPNLILELQRTDSFDELKSNGFILPEANNLPPVKRELLGQIKAVIIKEFKIYKKGYSLIMQDVTSKLKNNSNNKGDKPSENPDIKPL